MLTLACPNVQFDRNKFKDAVRFIIQNDEHCRLTKIKLHKALYFSDFFSYLQDEKPITGVDYVKQKFGPTARHLAWALRELKRDGSIKEFEEEHFGYIATRFKSLRDHEPLTLSERERATILKFVEFVCDKSATEISDLRHDAAWLSVALGETIPYHMAFRIIPGEVDDEDLDWAEQVILDNVEEASRPTSTHS